MTAALPDRALDLLTSYATEGLDVAAASELRGLLGPASLSIAEEFELAAAAVDLALASPPAALPSSLRNKLELQADVFGVGATVSRAAGPAAVGSAKVDAPQPLLWRPEEAQNRRSRDLSALGWLAAAAALFLAATAYWPRQFPASPATPAPESAQTQFAALTADPETISLPWGEWSDDQVKAAVSGVQGRVIWNERLQKGYMTFTGLRPNDPRLEQYQLWIIDSRGMGQRISGAVFNATPDGELIVPIDPRIPTKGAAAFAITIEEPGGTWVSDMSRRVVIAARG